MSNIFDIELPSGRKVKLTLPKMQAYVAGSQFPSALLEKLLEAEGGEIHSDLKLSPKEQVALIKFNGELVRRAMVSPKIVNEPSGLDEIQFSDLEDEDFQFVTEWVRRGGGEVESLESFRARPSKAA